MLLLPTFTGCQQPLGFDWWNFGHLPGQVPNGSLNADNSDKPLQKTFWSMLLYPACSGTAPPPPPGGTRSAYDQPGSNASAWNTPTGASATWSANGGVDALAICNIAGSGPPCTGIINSVASFGQTEYTASSFPNSGQSTYSFTTSGNGRTIAPDNGATLSALMHVPTGAITPGPYPGDNALILQDPINQPNRQYTWGGLQIPPPGLQPGQGPFTASSGEWDDITSDHFGEDPETGLSGSNVGAGLINACDVNPGCNPFYPKIKHALRYSIDAQQLKDNAIIPGTQVLNPNGWPTRLQDFQSGHDIYSGNLLAGSTLGIPAATAMPGGLDANCQGLFFTMQNYPLFFRDQAGGGFHLTVDQVADTSAWATSARACLSTLVNLLRRITNQHQTGQDFVAHPKNGPGARLDTGPLPLGTSVTSTGAVTWDPADLGGAVTLTAPANLVASSTGVGSVRSTTSYSSGKVCFEAVANTISNNWDFGIATDLGQ